MAPERNAEGQRPSRPILVRYLLLQEGEALHMEKATGSDVVDVQKYALGEDGIPAQIDSMKVSDLELARSKDWIASLSEHLSPEAYRSGYEVARSLTQIDMLLGSDRLPAPTDY